MHRRRFLRASGGVVGAFHLAGCTSAGSGADRQTDGDAPATVVESSNGGLTITIPNEALPAGTSADDISIERYEPDEMPYSLADGDLVGYRLEPDGLEFDRPVTVSIDFSDEPSVVPLLFHFDEESFDVLGDTSISIARDATGAYRASASAEIEHFSGFARSMNGLFSIGTQDGLRQYHVGEEIPFEFTIEPSGKVYQVRNQNGHVIAIYMVVEGSRYRVNTDERDQRFYGKNGRLVPETPLPAADLAHDETYRVSQPIRCRFSGTGAYLTLRSFVEYQRVSDYHNAGNVEEESTIYVTYEDTYRCLPREETEDATPDESDTTTDEPTRETIRAIPYGDTYIPLSELHVGAGTECDGADHYHAASGSVQAIDGSTIPDPNPGGCGFGKVSDVPVEEVPAP